MSPRDHWGRGQICRRSSSQQSRTRTKRSSYIPLEGLPTVLTVARAGHRPRKRGKLNSHWGIQSPRTHKQIYTYKVYRHIQKPATSCPRGEGAKGWRKCETLPKCNANSCPDLLAGIYTQGRRYPKSMATPGGMGAAAKGGAQPQQRRRRRWKLTKNRVRGPENRGSWGCRGWGN